MTLTRRRFLLTAARAVAGTTLVLGSQTAMGCGSFPFLPRGKGTVRIGIAGGTQTLWRYLVRRREEMLRPLGRDVELRPYNTEGDLRQAFLDNQVDIIATLPPAVPSLIQAGVEAQFFLPIAWIKEGYMFIARSDLPIQSMSDLAGKPVAIYPLTHPGFAYWMAFLPRNYGIAVRQLQYRETDNPEVPLQAGEVWAASVGSAQWSGLKQTQKYRKISDLSQEWRKISGSDELLMFGGYLARTSFIQENQDLIEQFIRVHHEMLKQYKANKQAVIEAITGDQAGPYLTREQNEFIAWYLGLDDVSPERVYISDHDVRSYEQVYSLLVEGGYLQKAPTSVEALFYRGKR
nr:ABC transporter substrate-binding protein [Chloroflexota bacterium]